MKRRKISFTIIGCALLISCSTRQAFLSPEGAERCPAQATNLPEVRLVPQENYGDAVLDLLDRKGKDGIYILQFNFFTDNKESSYPRRIADELINLRKKYPRSVINVALESRKDSNDPEGKGAAQRNAKTKAFLKRAGIDSFDVYGQSRELQNPAGREDGVSHAKLVMIGDEIIAGSSNLTKQSTDIGANNEMNLSVQSLKIAAAVKEYFERIVGKPGEMVDIEIEDGDVRLLTDRRHFDELMSQIKAAQKGDQIGLSMYQFLYRNENDIQAKQVLEELIAAHKRGAQLEIYFNRAEELTTQNTETTLRVAELLLSAGVTKVYLDPTAKISHSKFFYRISGNEKVALVSSVNIYRGDFNTNHQITWVLKRESVVDQLLSYFKQQIAYDGILVSRLPLDPKTGLRYNSVSKTWFQPEAPKRMLRFWRGFKQDKVTRVTFENNVNTRLIPETIEVGGGRGLNAYLPSFFSEGKPDFIPDEVAIIDYADEESYNAIRTTERGKKYGPLHFEEGLFAKQNQNGFSSASLVTNAFSGRVEILPEGRAYRIGSENTNWQQGITSRRTLISTENLRPEVLTNYFLELQKNSQRLGINSVVAVVDPRYVLLMLNSKDQGSALALEDQLNKLEGDQFKKFDHIQFKNQEHGRTNLSSGAGINVLFQQKVKPLLELKAVVRGEMAKKSQRNRCEQVFLR